jgi:hypothetical protein
MVKKDMEIRIKYDGVTVVDDKVNMKDFDMTIKKAKDKLW